MSDSQLSSALAINIFSLIVVLIGNYFGRLCSFNIIGFKRRRDVGNMWNLLHFAVVLINTQVSWYPLRYCDGVQYTSVQIFLIFIGKTRSEKGVVNQKSCKECLYEHLWNK